MQVKLCNWNLQRTTVHWAAISDMLTLISMKTVLRRSAEIFFVPALIQHCSPVHSASKNIIGILQISALYWAAVIFLSLTRSHPPVQCSHWRCFPTRALVVLT